MDATSIAALVSLAMERCLPNSPHSARSMEGKVIRKYCNTNTLDRPGSQGDAVQAVLGYKYESMGSSTYPQWTAPFVFEYEAYTKAVEQELGPEYTCLWAMSANKWSQSVSVTVNLR